MIQYPTIEAVHAADRMQICTWYRFLPSPGSSAIGTPEFETVLRSEGAIMDLIHQRLQSLGGFTPAISKAIGFAKPLS